MKPHDVEGKAPVQTSQEECGRLDPLILLVQQPFGGACVVPCGFIL